MLWKSEWSSGSHHIKPPPSQNGYSGNKFILIILAVKWLVRYSTSSDDLCLSFCIYPSSMLYSVRIVMITYKWCKCCSNQPPAPPLLCSEGWRGLWSCCCCWPWSSSWSTWSRPGTRTGTVSWTRVRPRTDPHGWKVHVLHKCSEHQRNGLKDNNMLGIVHN